MSRLSLPEWRGEADDAGRVVRDLDGWADSEELAALVAEFGGAVSSRRALRFDELARVADGWDARRGRERDQAPIAEPPRRLAELVLAGAPALGPAGRSEPVRRRYDAVLMTGGMVRAEIVKPRFVRQLLDGGVGADEVTFLGGFREFSAEETLLAEVLGISARNEVDAMAEGMDRAFGPLGPSAADGNGARDASGWRSFSWRPDDRRLGVLAAPSSAPSERRAHTADTFRFWADRRDTDHPVRSVLVVTTPIYVPYQAAVAVHVLGVERGIAVETIGVTDAASDLGDHSQPFLPQHHLQELRSAIIAMRALRRTLAARAGETG